MRTTLTLDDDVAAKLRGEARRTGPLVTDAALAALSIEHGATLHTTDRDFRRFANLRWTNPLESR